MEIKTLEIVGLDSVRKAVHLPYGKTDKEYTLEHDLELLAKLVRAGDEHAKAIRGLNVYVEITAPLYWWNEATTYRIGAEGLSSTSTMHTLGKRDLVQGDFDNKVLNIVLESINKIAKDYRETKATECLIAMKAMLPSSFNQTRVYMISYQTLGRIHRQRRHHRLPEWQQFCDWIETLPYQELITG